MKEGVTVQKALPVKEGATVQTDLPARPLRGVTADAQDAIGSFGARVFLRSRVRGVTAGGLPAWLSPGGRRYAARTPFGSR